MLPADAGYVGQYLPGGLSPLVVEQPATAIGQIAFGDQHDSQLYNYVAISCARGSGEIDPGDRKTLKLEVTSYLSDKPAHENLVYGRQHPILRSLGNQN